MDAQAAEKRAQEAECEKVDTDREFTTPLVSKEKDALSGEPKAKRGVKQRPVAVTNPVVIKSQRREKEIAYNSPFQKFFEHMKHQQKQMLSEERRQARGKKKPEENKQSSLERV